MPALPLSLALTCVLSACVPHDARAGLLRAAVADRPRTTTDGGGAVAPLRRPDDPDPNRPRAA